MTANWGE